MEGGVVRHIRSRDWRGRGEVFGPGLSIRTRSGLQGPSVPPGAGFREFLAPLQGIGLELAGLLAETRASPVGQAS